MMPLVALLHLCDSLFPIGAFGYSEGLEAAASSGHIRTPGDLGEWLDVCLAQSIGGADGPAVLRAWAAFNRGDWPTLAVLDAETHALRPSSGARRSSRAMGLRLVTTWSTLYPAGALGELLARAHGPEAGPTLPVAFGCVCASVGVDQRDAAAAFAYTRLASTISAAMRVMSIGQTDAHAQLAAVLRRLPTAVDEMIGRGDLESFTPAMDIALMSQPYLHSRLFRT
jgi:urease accessory protein